MPNKKPINRVAKGRRIEAKCAKEFEDAGYLVWRTIRHRFLNLDLFGKFDVAALAPDGSELVLIQVKSNVCPRAVIEDIRALKVPAGVKKMVWIWKDGKGWDKINCDKRGSE